MRIPAERMKPSVQVPPRPLTHEDEWDNPAMAEFKRQEAEDRAAFGHSAEAREWLEKLKRSKPRDEPIRLAPKFPQWQGFKIIRLPW